MRKTLKKRYSIPMKLLSNEAHLSYRPLCLFSQPDFKKLPCFLPLLSGNSPSLPRNLLPPISGKLAPALLFPPQPLWSPNHHHDYSPLHSHAPHAWSFFRSRSPTPNVFFRVLPKVAGKTKKNKYIKKTKTKKNGSTLMYDCLNIHKPVYDYVNFVEF